MPGTAGICGICGMPGMVGICGTRGIAPSADVKLDNDGSSGMPGMTAARPPAPNAPLNQGDCSALAFSVCGSSSASGFSAGWPAGAFGGCVEGVAARGGAALAEADGLVAVLADCAFALTTVALRAGLALVGGTFFAEVFALVMLGLLGPDRMSGARVGSAVVKRFCASRQALPT
jgi:hypothetical protein